MGTLVLEGRHLGTLGTRVDHSPPPPATAVGEKHTGMGQGHALGSPCWRRGLWGHQGRRMTMFQHPCPSREVYEDTRWGQTGSLGRIRP